MNLFPAVDPIPLPAPVWLFKALHILTLALHFTAVEMMLGGIIVAAWLNFRGSSNRGAPASSQQLRAAFSIARRLPVVMTFVINLGVPPLLFAQVLYGRALYTSSVLIGLWWISVVVLLTICYWLLYRFAARAEAGKSAWGFGLAAWVLAEVIARIYTSNMTLMLRPGVWNQMYSKSALGVWLPTDDPTITPRWLFMLAGGLTATGLWMIWLAGRKQIESQVRNYLAANGGRLALVMIVAQTVMAFFVFNAQPEAVRAGLAANLVYKTSGFGWLSLAALILGVAAWSALAKPATAFAGWLAASVGFLSIACMTLYRDGIRDLTLGLSNYDVWDRVVVTNWSVVGLFLVLFVIGLGVLGWLISVMVRAKTVSERVTS
ncbi:MAG: hypothetical protein MUF81_05715 [Verrucomicrobia bacterium]|jgi:hypothetical protein|nr:hypothetical protein [Verrucomicrobiota bacterium]